MPGGVGAGARRLLNASDTASAPGPAAADNSTAAHSQNQTVAAAASSNSAASSSAAAAECAPTSLQDYNLGLHIGANCSAPGLPHAHRSPFRYLRKFFRALPGSVFILLGVSLAGSLIPVALHIGRANSWTMVAIK